MPAPSVIQHNYPFIRVCIQEIRNTVDRLRWGASFWLDSAYRVVEVPKILEQVLEATISGTVEGSQEMRCRKRLYHGLSGHFGGHIHSSKAIRPYHHPSCRLHVLQTRRAPQLRGAKRRHRSSPPVCSVGESPRPIAAVCSLSARTHPLPSFARRTHSISVIHTP